MTTLRDFPLDDELGGSQTFKTVRFPFAWNTPNIATTGVSVYVPTARDFLLFFTFSITSAWNGTTPTGYLTTQGNDPDGGPHFTAEDLTVGVDLTPLASGVTHMSKPRDVNLYSPVATVAGAFFDDATPLLLFVRDDSGSGASGATTGTGELLLHISPAA